MWLPYLVNSYSSKLCSICFHWSKSLQEGIHKLYKETNLRYLYLHTHETNYILLTLIYETNCIHIHQTSHQSYCIYICSNEHVIVLALKSSLHFLQNLYEMKKQTPILQLLRLKKKKSASNTSCHCSKQLLWDFTNIKTWFTQ